MNDNLLSVVTPAFNEELNIPLLYQRLKSALDPLVNWEWVVVDDHSIDGTVKAVQNIVSQDSRVSLIELEHNQGAHVACYLGLMTARGECVVAMASDLQDPPELIETLFEKWRDGNEIVWAIRKKREGESFHTLFFSRIYYFFLRYILALKNIHSMGADFFLIDRRVISQLKRQSAQIESRNILIEIGAMSFKQCAVDYVKQRRERGRSGWTLKKKLKLLWNSIKAARRSKKQSTDGLPDNLYNSHAWIIGDPQIGKGCWIGAFTVIDGQGGLTIGKGVDVSCGASILTHSTVRRCVTERAYNKIDLAPTVIEDYVFIGENAVILKGCQIGHHSIVGAGAVVLENTIVPPHSLVVGVPAKVVPQKNI